MRIEELPLFPWHNAYAVERAQNDPSITSALDFENSGVYWHVLYDRTGEPTRVAAMRAYLVDPHVHVYIGDHANFVNLVIFATNEPLSEAQIAEISQGFPRCDVEVNRQ